MNVMMAILSIMMAAPRAVLLKLILLAMGPVWRSLSVFTSNMILR